MEKKNSAKEDKGAEIVKEYERLSSSRGNEEGHWTEIAERMIPAHSPLFLSKGFQSKGDKRTTELYDSTAAIALNRFASILDSLLTPRNQTWHRLSATDPALNKNRNVKLWFEEVTRLLFRYRYDSKANFSAQNQQNYKSLGAYGTGCVFVDDLAGEVGFRYRNIHLSEIYFAENHQGVVDTAVRYFALTARQAIQKWGKELPDSIFEKAKVNPDTEVFFLHCVKPRKDMDYQRKDYKGMPFASYYVSMEGKVLVSEGGYNSFPYAISRYEQTSGEVYGRSPAMDVLPAVKTLNEQKKTLLRQGHLALAPALLAHDDGIMDTLAIKPGHVNWGGVSADGRPLVHALPTGNIAIGKDMMDDERAIIKDAFLVSLFQLLIDSPQKTATEVMELAREKGILIAPTLGRQNDEYLGPMIEREIDLAIGQRLLPPMPPELVEAKGEYSIVYDSPLSRAQRMEEAAGLMRTIEMTLQMVNVTQNPEPLDFYNMDIITPELNDINGVPERWMRSAEEVQAIREGRSREAEDQKMIQAAPAAASMVKAVGAMNKGG